MCCHMARKGHMLHYATLTQNEKEHKLHEIYWYYNFYGQKHSFYLKMEHIILKRNLISRHVFYGTTNLLHALPGI